MFDLFPITSGRFAATAFKALFRSPGGGASVRVRRAVIMLGFLPVFALVQGIHWIGFLLDDLLFRGWRRVEIREPLFVLGVPRSGTTRLHEVLAKDEQYTTFSTWECLFALSVTERRFWLALARIDVLVGAPGARILGWIERLVFAALEEVHAMGLDTPEEDYFALMPILSCFILALPFPASEHLWRVGRFDQALSPEERARVLDFYQGCLQKHLYVHGQHKRLLSKNAAFAPWAQSLAERFPDARFLVCLRDPLQTIPSQLSSIAPGLAFFGVPPDSAIVRERLLAQLAFYYENLNTLARSEPPERCVTVTLPQLKAALAATLTAVYERLGLPLAESFRSVLEQADESARSYRSGHRYTLEQFDVDADWIEQRFAAPYRQCCASNCALKTTPAASGPASVPPPVRRQRPRPGSPGDDNRRSESATHRQAAMDEIPGTACPPAWTRRPGNAGTRTGAAAGSQSEVEVGSGGPC